MNDVKLCPICGAETKRQIRYKTSDGRFGKSEGMLNVRREFGTHKLIRTIEKPSGNVPQKKYIIFYCEKCNLGWQKKDTAQMKITPPAAQKLTVKEFKRLNGLN